MPVSVCNVQHILHIRIFEYCGIPELYTFSPYRAVNNLRRYYKNQPFNCV